MKGKEITIVGAGPAGLGVAIELQKNNITDILIIDMHSKPGGLSRTEVFDNNRFDIGPHRFFTKNKEINELWHEILGNDFKPVKRFTRIYYNNKYFNYPLKPFNALKNLGFFESYHAIISYIFSQVKVSNNEIVSFEDWVCRHFGEKLYKTFFKNYTEKVWGIECKNIGADWAAQRIKDLNLYKAMIDALNPTKHNKSVKTLVEEFDYPVYGAGMMYEKMSDRINKQGGEILFNTIVKKVNIKDNKILSVFVNNNEKEFEIPVETLFSSMPLTKFIESIKPKVKKNILTATRELFFRDHITVNLIIDNNKLFKDQWIYIHSREVKMGRLANYNNFSSCMPGNKKKSVVSVEYFVFKNDDIWNMPDKDIIELAKEELNYMNLVNRKLVKSGFVIRETESYPTYFIGFEKYYKIVSDFVSNISNLQCIGRGGMYKYNNQDHSLYTGLLAAKNYCGADYNIWNVNIDAEYHENAKRQE